MRVVALLIGGGCVTAGALIWRSRAARARVLDEWRQRTAEQAAYVERLVQRFGDEAARSIVAKEPWQGATAEMIREMFGEPENVSTKVYKTKTAETWKYERIGPNAYALRVKIENGVCVGWTKN